ncbi:MAG: insulinase family protein [Ruminococcus sp.]|nr:insulinase family protein [Ruminococcus sp.]
MKYNRAVFDGNIGFSSVIDEKFKTNSLVIRFITELSADTAADNAVAFGILSDTSSEYRTISELNEKLSMLYGASLSSSAVKRGDLQILGVRASWLSNRYAIDGEDITGEMLDIVCGCLFSPNAADGKFDEEAFRITKRDLLDKIESEINNKRGYALARAAEVAFSGEPAGHSCYGTKETAEKVTPGSAYKAYKRILEQAQVEIFYIAPEENPEVEKRLREQFAGLERSSKNNTFDSPSPLKSEPERVSEEFDVKQSKMVLAFKTESDDKPAVKLLSTVFGETPVSKLFMNVREKLSLCYYCASRTAGPKRALFVDCGVEKDNIGKAEAEILHQLDEIRNGNISDEELSSAVLSIENALRAVGDTPSSYAAWYFERFCENDMITPQEQFEIYKAVTKERIVAAAKSLKLDSVYLMLNKEVQE